MIKTNFFDHPVPTWKIKGLMGYFLFKFKKNQVITPKQIYDAIMQDVELSKFGSPFEIEYLTKLDVEELICYLSIFGFIEENGGEIHQDIYEVNKEIKCIGDQ